jgi:flagellar motor switch/type III secretory pathway protein FliN
VSDAVLSKEVSMQRLATAQAAKIAASGGSLAQVEQHRQWPILAQLPLKLDVSVALAGFKVRDLLALRTGKTVSSLWKVSEDVPVRIGDLEFGWGEFEVVDQRMSVRLTRLG